VTSTPKNSVHSADSTCVSSDVPVLVPANELHDISNLTSNWDDKLPAKLAVSDGLVDEYDLVSDNLLTVQATDHLRHSNSIVLHL
jgi:hypothetical protein